MAVNGSGGYGGAQGNGGASFGQVENSLRNIALQFASIVSLQQQLLASIQAWRTLEKELSLTRAAAEATSEQFREMERASRAFALSSSFTAAQVANGMYNLASAGLNAAQTMAALPGVLLLAQATLTDLGEAADTTSATLSQFGLQANETYRIANLFVASTNTSLATMSKLSFALRQVGPIANQANLSLEQTVGILDKLFDAGLRGEQAGTALRNVIARLIDPAGDGQILLQNLGVDTIDRTTGEFRDLIDIMKELSELNLSVGDISVLAGVEGAAGFTTLLEQVKVGVPGATSALEEHIAAITGTSSAYKQAVIQMQTLDGQMIVLGNAFNEIRIEIGQSFAPLIQDLTQWFVSFAESLSQTRESTKLAWLQWGLFAATIAASVGFMLAAAAAVAKLATAWAAFRAAIAAGSIATGIGATAAGIGTLIATGAGLIALAAIVVGLGYAWKQAGEAADAAKLDEAFDAVAERRMRENPATPEERSRILDDNNYAEAAVMEGRNLRRTRMVDDRTGAGAGTFVSQVKAHRADLQADIAAAQREQADMIRDRDVFAERYAADWEKISNFGDLQRQLIAQGGFGTGTGLGPVMSEALDDLAGSNRTQIRAAFRAYYDTLIDTIEKSGESGAVKSTLIASAQEKRAELDSIHEDVLITLADNLTGGTVAFANASAENDINGDSVQLLNAFNNLLGDTLDATENALDISSEEYAARIAEIGSQIRVMQGEVTRSNNDISDELQNVIKEITTVELARSNLDEGERTAALQAIMEQLNEQGSGWLSEVAAEIAAGRSTEGRDKLIEALVARRLATQEDFAEGITVYLATPLIRQEDLRRLEREGKLDLLNAQREFALAVNPTADVSGIITEFNTRERAALQENAADVLIDQVTSGGPDNERVRQNITTAVRENIGRQLAEIAATADNARKEALAESVAQQFIDAGSREEGELIERTALARAMGLEAGLLASDTDRLQGLRSNTERQTKGRNSRPQKSAAEEIRDALRDLPSAEELEIIRQRITTEARHRITDYLEMPLTAITRAMEMARLDNRQALVDFQKNYTEFLTGTLGKDVAAVTNNQELRDAFSGKLIADALNTGQTTFNGNVYTRESLQSVDGMRSFLSAVEDRFTSLLGNAPAAQERISEARRILAAMAGELTATLSDQEQQLRVLELQRRDTQREVDDFLRQFDMQSVVDRFEQVLQRSSIPGQENQLTLEFAVRASVATVEIEGEQAFDKVRTRFEEMFRNRGIPVSFNPSTRMFELLSDVNVSTDPMQLAATALTGSATALTNAASALSGAASGGNARPAGATSGADYLAATRALLIQREGFVARAMWDVNAHRVGYGSDTTTDSAGRVSRVNASTTTTRDDAMRDLNRRITEFRLGIERLVGADKFAEFSAAQQAALTSIAYNYGSLGRGGAGIDDTVRTGTLEEIAAAIRGLGGHNNGINRERRNQEASAFEGGNRDIVVTAAPSTPVTLTPEQQQFIDNANAVLRETLEITRIQAEFERSNPRVIEVEMLQRRGENFDSVQGRAYDAERFMAELRSSMASTMIDLNSGRDVNSSQDIQRSAEFNRMYVIQREIGELDVERQNALQQMNRDYEIQITRVQTIANGELQRWGIDNNLIQAGQTLADLSQEQRDNLRSQYITATEGSEEYQNAVETENALKETQRDLNLQINEQYDKRIELAGRSVESQREQLGLLYDQIQRSAEQDGQNTTSDIFAGLRASMVQFAREVPTVFETMANLGKTALDGLVNAGAAALTGTGGSVKKMLASMFASMAQLIAKMLAMWAIMQIISAFPGGKALLAALDAGAGIGGQVAVGVTQTVGTIGASALGKGFAKGGIGGEPIDPSAYANSPVFGANDLMRGGVRAAGASAWAVFGEGQHPEAFIPMVDGRTVPVHYDADGNGYIPLPSGLSIPVSTKTARAFEKGGVGGKKPSGTMYDRVRALAADKVTSSGSEALSPYRLRAGGSMPAPTINNTDIGGIHINVQGNATAEDSTVIATAVAKQIEAILKAREAEDSRQRMRRTNTVQHEYYGAS